MASAQQAEVGRTVLADQDGGVVVLRIYMDESGVHDGSPVVTVAAYIERPRNWRKWTRAWNAEKRKVPAGRKPIKVFHAVDAQNLQEEFEGWSEPERDDLVKRLLPIIVDREMPGIVIGIQMDEFRKAMAGHPDLPELIGNPYGACFQWVIQSILFLQSRAGSNERLAFVHERNNFHEDALLGFNFAKEHSNPQQAPIGILFGDKADYPPLQAADILAYEGNKRMRDPDRPPRRPWQVLNPDGRIISADYGRENMPQMVEHLQKIKENRIPEIILGEDWRKQLISGPAAAWMGRSS